MEIQAKTQAPLLLLLVFCVECWGAGPRRGGRGQGCLGRWLLSRGRGLGPQCDAGGNTVVAAGGLYINRTLSSGVT